MTKMMVTLRIFITRQTYLTFAGGAFEAVDPSPGVFLLCHILRTQF